jgi:hypothetical protein
MALYQIRQRHLRRMEAFLAVQSQRALLFRHHAQRAYSPHPGIL